MAGPRLDPNKTAQFQKSFDPDSHIYNATNSAVHQATGKPATPDTSAQPTPATCANCGHSYEIDPVKQQAAADATAAYMKANHVDANGDPVQQ